MFLPPRKVSEKLHKMLIRLVDSVPKLPPIFLLSPPHFRLNNVVNSRNGQLLLPRYVLLITDIMMIRPTHA